MSKTAQIEFPPIFVEYAKKKLKRQRELIEHHALFGPPLFKEMAQMILAAAGEKVKNPAKAHEQQLEMSGRK